MTPKVIVITGASSGIGRALAAEYAGTGIRLGLLGRDAARLQEVADLCRRQGAAVETGLLDVRDTGPLVEWLHAFDTRHAVDLVIANAGIVSGTGPGDSTESLTAALRVIDVNLKGAMATAAALVERMRQRRSGHLALISSLAGLAPQPDLPSYSASKAGLVSYGSALRVRLKREGVAVTVVCPGYIDTPMTLRERSAKPFTWSADRAARHIRHGLDRKRRLIAFPWPLALGIRLLMLAPLALQDRILAGFTAEIVPDERGAGDAGS
jgi:short-subunit dehydrogenase